MLHPDFLSQVTTEYKRGIEKWGKVDQSPSLLLNAATEELGEVAHAINHNEGKEVIKQEVAETVGILARLWEMAGSGV